ncbi:porin family protein [Caballeronia sp. dw_276]|uniref:porin family protein n=1 Tax=Caballeronia sp. dw_276 TaxID=2719795 RepID=UPI0032119A1F
MQRTRQLILLFDSTLCIHVMFNFKRIFAALVITLTGLSAAQASEFSGPYAGLKVGENWSDASGVVNVGSHASTFLGLTAGYNFDVSSFVIGAEAFADFHNSSTTYKDAGIDAKLGLPFNTVMPYVRLGATGSWPNVRFHTGLGVEYKFIKQASLALEWTADQSKHDGTTRHNNSVTLGVHYFF